ncbi:amidase [Thalassobacillus devorans]|uniref:Amidase n=1 Tax=Thalassobacillus devorans TaxID=279813 RepID=A0ABQ1NK40_9BACI|nr:amidase [Thalassobacillus devorans]NIK27378.1 amidase [Thalassobacillus devorans]GGC77225.1 amidase [Thalassobacillus devorans]
MGNVDCLSTARHLAKAIKDRDVSAREVMEAHLVQIDKVNTEVNAIVSLDKEHALKEADQADKLLAGGEMPGPLHGLPVAIKDTHQAKGFPMTSGSLALRDNISTEDDLHVERLKKAGAIIIGKTNVPEFGAGAHTFNEVFGVTRNPYSPAYTAGGSSGGAAVAVTTGMLPFADGSDMGGSCRFPTAFNNVVGMRTSPGRIPYPKPALYSPLVTQGPIARNVEDASLMLSIMAGPDNRSPISIEESGEKFLQPFSENLTGLRIAWSADFGGALPVESDVKRNVEAQMNYFTELGCHVEEACPDLTEAEEVFHVFRAWEIEMSYSELFEQYEDVMKPSFKWNFNIGRSLRGSDLGRAERLRSLLYHRMRTFFEKYDALVLPVSQVTPFDINLEYPAEINEVKMENYIDWMRSCYYISALGNPALSVPSGFTEDGRPLGLQIVGPHRADYDVLQIGRAFERTTNYGKQRPPIATAEGGHIST